MFVCTKDLQKVWKVSRSSLHSLRKEEILKQSLHWQYVANGKRKLVIYNLELIKDGLINGFESESHNRKCIEFRRKHS